MASCIDMVSSAEQLCYIPCNFCNIVLAVSVPCSSLFDVVTVRCGHCTNLWSVNMASAAFHPTSSPAWPPPAAAAPATTDFLLQAPTYNSQDYRIDAGNSSKYYSNDDNNNISARTLPPVNVVEERVVNRPPEKRQRVPSAYNQFIKEEIQRIKANNPDISHREAFSTAAKNWAHFPHIHFGLMLETGSTPKLDDGSAEKHVMARAALMNN